MDLNVVDVKFQGEVKWKALPELELSALGAVRYQASSQEHNIKDHSNQATAYRTGMDDAPFDDEKQLIVIPIRIIRMLCLSVYYRKEVFTSVRTIACWE